MLRPPCFVLTFAALTLSAAAQTKPDDHAAHHPASAPTAAAPASKAPADKAAMPAPAMAERMAKMDEHIKAMQAMRDKMMAARSPEERQALMGEQMGMMREGMAMMEGMSGMGGMGPRMGPGAKPADLAARQAMMEKRMDMMQSMMKMMMDRMGPAPTAPAAK